MQIKISEKLHPFSHQPGTKVIVPGTGFGLQIFPTHLTLEDLSQNSSKQPLGYLYFKLEGPIEQFTVTQDLEKCKVSVWGRAKNGYFRYHCYVKEDALVLELEKTPLGGLHMRGFWELEIDRSIQPKNYLILKVNLNLEDKNRFTLIERLSLGNHKLQDAEKIRGRLSMQEIFPWWLKLGSLIPACSFSQNFGSLALLQECEQVVMQGKKQEILDHFKKLYTVGLESLLYPRLQDTQFQGYDLTPHSHRCTDSPLPILYKGASLIRTLFFKQENTSCYFLPLLPVEFHCGRYINIGLKEGILSFEWTKRCIRRLVFKASQTCVLDFHFPKEIKSFRMRRILKEKGQRMIKNQPLFIEANHTFYLDNFFC